MKLSVENSNFLFVLQQLQVEWNGLNSNTIETKYVAKEPEKHPDILYTFDKVQMHDLESLLNGKFKLIFSVLPNHIQAIYCGRKLKKMFLMVNDNEFKILVNKIKRQFTNNNIATLGFKVENIPYGKDIDIKL